MRDYLAKESAEAQSEPREVYRTALSAFRGGLAWRGLDRTLEFRHDRELFLGLGVHRPEHVVGAHSADPLEVMQDLLHSTGERLPLAGWRCRDRSVYADDDRQRLRVVARSLRARAKLGDRAVVQQGIEHACPER